MPSPGLKETHDVTLGIGEQCDAWALRHVHWPHRSAPSETLDLAQRRLEVGDLEVEGEMARTASPNRSYANASVDATLTTGMRHRIVRNRRLHLPVRN